MGEAEQAGLGLANLIISAGSGNRAVPYGLIPGPGVIRTDG